MPIKRSWPLILALGLAALPSTTRSQGGLITVHLANGEALPLQDTQLTYEYQMWAKNTPRVLGRTKKRESPAIVIGKDRYPVAGMVVAFDHSQGRVRLEITQSNGKKKIKKIRAPDRKSLLPDVDKNMMVQIRSLDITGQTLTGTRRSFCLISFTSMVECSSDAEYRVVRIEF